MNIILQGLQGVGKTRTAEHIANAYTEETIIRLDGFKKKYEAKIIKHCKTCNDRIPLIIFDDLTRDELIAALACVKRITSLKVFEQSQIDTIFTTQERLNIS